ncbi:unnamed protein product [Didymodactylos carnosus]|uniref:IF rod domain-containing protein n=2 Tax=Didymodactylos carnosus TaxID=1234261 RepID=A0A813VSR7_9BILA|nr:unnamed protein product [Didymodactylos carnosus]CAF3632395.1 unnamed protein product [Didymodactylos carnosus]
MEKRILKFEFDVGSTSHSTSRSTHEDIGKAMTLVQRERGRDIKEKEELRHLNDRFSHFLTNIEQLKRLNENLQQQLKDEFSKWGILPRDENKLRSIVIQINDRAMKRANDEVKIRACEQDTAILNRASNLYENVQDMYRRKQENLQNIIDKLQEELQRILQREKFSEEEILSTQDDLNKEIKKYQERLNDWLKVVVEKQTLLDDIQSLRESMNLVNALNDEEINEWKRLLDQSKDDSILFYKDELTNAIRDIKRDYSKQVKKFQDELEYQIEGQLRLVENQLKQQLSFDGDEKQNSEKKNRLIFEERKLHTSIEEYDKEQIKLNNLIMLLSGKKRLLRDEEMKLHELERKIRDKQLHERLITDRLKLEYEDLRQKFEQMAFELRFSIEDELKIYARLLDELMKKSSTTISSTTTALSSRGANPSTSNYTYTTSSMIRSGGIEGSTSGVQSSLHNGSTPLTTSTDVFRTRSSDYNNRSSTVPLPSTGTNDLLSHNYEGTTGGFSGWSAIGDDLTSLHHSSSSSWHDEHQVDENYRLPPEAEIIETYEDSAVKSITKTSIT